MEFLDCSNTVHLLYMYQDEELYQLRLHPKTVSQTRFVSLPYLVDCCYIIDEVSYKVNRIGTRRRNRTHVIGFGDRCSTIELDGH